MRPGPDDRQISEVFDDEKEANAERDRWAGIIVTYEVQDALRVFVAQARATPKGRWGHAVFLFRDPTVPVVDSAKIARLIQAILAQKQNPELKRRRHA